MSSTSPEGLEQRSPEWFEARKAKITGSIAGAILGDSPWMKREDVMRMMVRQHHNAPSENEENIAMAYGSFHEDGARFDFELETGMKVNDCGFMVCADDDIFGASPDGLIGDDTVLEIKVPFGKRKDETPVFKPLLDQPHYYSQVQMEMKCSSRTRAYFYQWAPNGTAIEVVHWDQDWADWAIPRLRQFYAEYLSERDNPDHLAPKRVTVDTPQSHLMSAEYDQLTEAIALAEERKKELLAEIVDLAGGKNATFAGRKLTKVDVKGKVSYAKAVVALIPEADLSKWTGKSSSHWRFGS